MKTYATVAIVEAAIVLGIIASVFIVPRSFPLKWFLNIALGVLMIANVILFNALKKRDANRSYRLGYRAYIGLAFVAIYWVLCLVWR